MSTKNNPVHEEVTATEDVEKDLPEQETQEQEMTESDPLADAIERVQELEEQLAEAAKKEQDILLRSRAEIDNIRRRATQDVEKAHKFALEKFAKDLLESIDNLERALAVPTDEMAENVRAIIDGVELTLKGLLKTVENYGIKAVGEVGESFNPELHHAIKQEQVEGMDSNKITNVLQKGYTLNGRVIRPAMVMISA
ncbi:nucleotide exchange factor GrpE [Actinobacillus delphinicola]|uniref:Protein GrpE n=1 Tax=Actinobacillus delphinicola TaxID=51161 RepID=A0A448TVP5_9PAST|nr:nucleotide exchange factor GrpE [Actinobacillus delphinicola]MDG6896514.1 nucleotide exchange factor GrpE [Actinobacillus delphinicola]VEJ09993.1 heat shock protein GrpE [Actinobacillus delphinicola]